MKYKFRYCGIFILLKALTGSLSVSGSEIMPKFVCPGDSVQLFQNITFDNCSSVVSLYTNGERNTLIARWSFQNCSRNETLLPDDKVKVFLYGNGTISILNVHPWDQAKYIVISQIGDISVKDVVKINVMAAPANDCRPRILHLGNSLFASLKANVCGKPVATLYWKGYGDVPNTSEPVLKLTPGNQDGTYYACIEGPAVTCAGNSLDYCSKFTIKENISPPILSETWDVKTPIFIVVGIVLGISLILAIAVILIRKRCSKTISRALKGADLNRGASGDARVKIGENEELEDRKFDPGPLTVLIGSEDHLDNLHDELCRARMQTDQPRPTHDDNLHDELCIARMQTDQPRPTHDAISRALKGADLNRGASGDARIKFGENEELEDRKFDPGPLTVLIGSEDHLDNLHDELCIARMQTDQPRPTHDDNLHDELCIARMQTDQPRPTHDDNFHDEQCKPLMQMDQPRPAHDESGQHTVPLEENHELWAKYFDSLKWEDIKQLLNDEQQQGLKNDCAGETPIKVMEHYRSLGT